MRVEAAPRYAGQSGLSTRFVTSLPHFAAPQSLQTPISDPGQPRPFQRVSPSFPFESDPLRSPHTRITRFPGPILQRISNLKRMADASTDDSKHKERVGLVAETRFSRPRILPPPPPPFPLRMSWSFRGCIRPPQVPRKPPDPTMPKTPVGVRPTGVVSTQTRHPTEVMIWFRPPPRIDSLPRARPGAGSRRAPGSVRCRWPPRHRERAAD